MSTDMEIHVGEDYATIILHGNPIATKTYPTDRTVENLGKICERYNASSAMIEATKECLKAERNRRKKLLDGAPASDYCDARIAKIEAALKMAGAL